MVARLSIADSYKELGINRHATSNDIRTAYKRLALIWHPDRNKAKDAEEKFKKIKQAYDILIEENRRQEYNQQQQYQYYTQPNEDVFHFYTFDDFTSTPVDPLDILSDIQSFQESDFTSKMMNSSSYRNLYTHLFNTMNNNSPTNRQKHSSSPIYLDNDHLFHSNTKSRSKYPSTPINSIPVIHSTMPNDWFLNELIDLHEQQNIPNIYYSSFNNDFIHCINCQNNISIQRNQPYRYPTVPSKSVRV